MNGRTAPQCRGRKKDGSRCNKPTLHPSVLCHLHRDQADSTNPHHAESGSPRTCGQHRHGRSSVFSSGAASHFCSRCRAATRNAIATLCDSCFAQQQQQQMRLQMQQQQQVQQQQQMQQQQYMQQHMQQPQQPQYSQASTSGQHTPIPEDIIVQMSGLWLGASVSEEEEEEQLQQAIALSLADASNQQHHGQQQPAPSQQLSSAASDADSTSDVASVCAICKTDPPRVMFSPCNHCCACEKCALHLTGGPCPICRQPGSMQRVYFS